MRKIVYSYLNGKLERNWLQNGECFKEEVLYTHLQKRDMTVEEGVLDQDSFLIRDGQFIKYQEITRHNIRSIANERLTMNNIKIVAKYLLRKAHLYGR